MHQQVQKNDAKNPDCRRRSSSKRGKELENFRRKEKINEKGVLEAVKQF